MEEVDDEFGGNQEYSAAPLPFFSGRPGAGSS